LDPTRADYWIDLAIKLGAFVTVLYIAVRWGRFQQLVESGFRGVEEKLDGVRVTIDSHNRQLAEHERKLGRLEGLNGIK
jgi:hypothetical protein